VTKVDEYTIKLERPTPTFIMSWGSAAPIPGFTLHSKDHFEAVGAELAQNQTVGAGPWSMDEYKTDEFRRVNAVENHYRKTPNWAQLIWWDIREESTRLANFTTGVLDTGIFTDESIQAIRAENMPGVEFMAFPLGLQPEIRTGGQYYYPEAASHLPNADGDVLVPLDAEYPNGYLDVCDDGVHAYVSCNRDLESAEWANALNVRKAMDYAIDRQKLINNLVFGEGQPWYTKAWGYLPTRMAQFGLDENERAYDPAKAKELLTAAGYPDGIDVEFVKATGEDLSNAMIEAIGPMWLEVGIRATYSEKTDSHISAGQNQRSQMHLAGKPAKPGFPEPLRELICCYRSIGSTNLGFEHPKLDELIDASVNSFDLEERWASQAATAQFMFDQVAVIPVIGVNVLWPLGPELGNFIEDISPAELDWICCWEYATHRE
jgi:ABC-type transport system substrate-binding protein